MLNQINNVRRSYAWYGEADQRAPENVKWGKVCRPNKEGVLGLRNIHFRNVVAVGEIDWRITTNQDSMWVN